jgi:hypothetical protein
MKRKTSSRCSVIWKTHAIADLGEALLELIEGDGFHRR